jgi:hypothetical protein
MLRIMMHTTLFIHVHQTLRVAERSMAVAITRYFQDISIYKSNNDTHRADNTSKAAGSSCRELPESES